MKILKLQLENFRNYSAKTFEFNENPFTLQGPNGMGKTNALEAIYLLSLGRSFKTPHLEDLILWEESHFRCRAVVENADEQFTLEVFFSAAPQRKRNFRLNEVNLPATEYFSIVPVVLFHPEDLNTLYLSPDLRRKYLNILLSQASKQYLLDIQQYTKILAQRNALLKAIRNQLQPEELLDTFDLQLTTVGTKIIAQRRAYIEYLAAPLQRHYREISAGQELVTVEYQTKIREDYLAELKLKRSLDIIKGQTTLGPHRDDLLFRINNKEISTSASRGEIRSLLLAVKLTEIAYLEEKTTKKPILLLDDVFSELDHDRSEHLVEAVKGFQTIITTVS